MEKETEREREGKREGGRERIQGERDKKKGRGETLLTPVWYKSCRAPSWPVDIFGIKSVSLRCIIPREGPFARRSIGHGIANNFCFCFQLQPVDKPRLGWNNGVSTTTTITQLCRRVTFRHLPRTADGIKPSHASIWRAAENFFFPPSLIFRESMEGGGGVSCSWNIYRLFGSRVFWMLYLWKDNYLVCVYIMISVELSLCMIYLIFNVL